MSDDWSEVGWSMKGDGLQSVAVGLHDTSYALAKGILRVTVLSKGGDKLHKTKHVWRGTALKRVSLSGKVLKIEFCIKKILLLLFWTFLLWNYRRY